MEPADTIHPVGQRAENTQSGSDNEESVRSHPDCATRIRPPLAAVATGDPSFVAADALRALSVETICPTQPAGHPVSAITQPTVFCHACSLTLATLAVAGANHAEIVTG